MPGTALPLLKERWQSAVLTGGAQHALTVRVRKGHMHRDYMATNRIDDGSPIFPPLIWKGINYNCWQGQWVVDSEWVILPHIVSAKWTQAFQDNGTSTLTVIMDNVIFVESEGVAGMYHDIQRGWFAPSRGVKVAARPDLWDTNSWFNVLNGGYQIELWEGYGTAEETTPLHEPNEAGTCNPGSGAVMRTWTGIIDQCEPETLPDRITITARDFSIFFTDQRMMGWNKAREIRSPVTFADRERTMGETDISGNPKASSGTVTVRNKNSGAQWRSDSQGSPDDTEWVEITLPTGYYTDFFLSPRYDGMEMWVSVYNGINADGSNVGSMDRTVPLDANSWVDLSDGDDVPGANGGIPYVRHIANVWGTPSRRWEFGHSFYLSDNSRVRLSFRGLSDNDDDPGYFAGTNAFKAFRYGDDPSAATPGAHVNANHWILVEDVADVIRMLFIWAGFKEWFAEEIGWTIDQPMVFGEDAFFMDVITEIMAQGNYLFYMLPPTDDDMSIGVPQFSRQRATDPVPNSYTREIRDTDMTEALDIKWDMSNLPYVMRYRGEVSDDGQALGQDTVKRFMATYYPPWSGQDYTVLNSHGKETWDNTERVAGVRRHFTETLGATSTIGLQSDDECLFACILAAIQYALAECMGQLQTAGLPGFWLNEQISLVDESTGTNGRMWVMSVESDHIMGPNGSWHMTVGGAMVDTEDMILIHDDYLYAYKQYLWHKGPTSEQRQAPLPN